MEFTELNQLCEDILAFRRDIAELKRKEKQEKKKKKEEDRKKGEEIRKAVVVWVSSPLNSRSDWLLGLFKMAAGVVIRIQDGGA